MPTLPAVQVETPAALRALLAEIIDYAGLFPPARLPLDDAIRNFARYRQGPEAWMLARFIIPARRLAELDAYAELFAEGLPFRFSALGTGGDDTPAFLDALDSDLAAIRRFRNRFDANVQVDVMEVRLPTALLDDTAALRRFFDAVHTQAPDLDFFFEILLDDRLRTTASAVLNAMTAFNREHEATLGFKMRTGGTEPEMHPAPEPVAYAITACREAGVRFKATAGLHHPLRHFNEGVQARMHGFFNLFGGAVLAEAHDLSETALTEILREENAADFRFTDDGLAWRDLSASVEDIRRARETLATSFGSCSFDEPREDLQALGLL